MADNQCSKLASGRVDSTRPTDDLPESARVGEPPSYDSVINMLDSSHDNDQAASHPLERATLLDPFPPLTQTKRLKFSILLKQWGRIGPGTRSGRNEGRHPWSDRDK